MLLFIGSIAGCAEDAPPPLFTTLQPEQTNVTFSNDLQSEPDFNMLNYLYFYDGGGVSIGDVNSDGLPDLYLTANMKANKLYLNQGNFEFKDITENAGVAGTGDWTTGTTMADVNGDGLLDIYVSNVHYLSKTGRNELFINNGDGTFSERAKEFGLDFQGYAKQASFFDYDRDGDLDMYLLNHAVHSEDSYGDAKQRNVDDPHAGDRLYRNEGGFFKNVTEEAGIYNSITGYGLGVANSDFNNDGCPDIYVSNDFHENDYLYLNNCDGTFTEVIEQATGHTSRASMGNDAADFNNDGWVDLYVADMLPRTEEGLKTAISSETYKVYTIQRQFGYHPQLVQNTLQLNRGADSTGQLRFSEIAQYSGVNATDWSWATLFLDMNNDGFKDLYVTNGIYRRPNNLDYLLYVRRDSTQQMMGRQSSANNLTTVDKMPHTKIPNAGFINNGDYTFSYKSDALGFGQPTYSNGAAYGDLDNDGDLDLVTNNVNGTPTIQRNLTRENNQGRYLQISLQGIDKNTQGIGSKVTVYDSSSVQKYELYTTRGFLSSVEPRLTIGVGQSHTIDSLRIIWPNGASQTQYDIATNQSLKITQEQADTSGGVTSRHSDKETIFKNITDSIGLDYSHQEDTYVDFNRQPLTPFMLSSEGPAFASGDVNNDGMDDFFVGGAKGQPGTIFVQQESGGFRPMDLPTLEHDAMFEDVDASFFDADGDGWLDLYVVSGGNEYSYQSEGLCDRFYLNNQKGGFVKVEDAFPPVYDNGSVAVPADYDGDGDTDLFVGSRSVPQNYGVSPDSHLFENQGSGVFEDVTDAVAPQLRQLGMVTDAAWADLDNDGALDLIIAGEWMPITIFYNRDGTLQKVDDQPLAETAGWWQSITTADFDDDGDKDIIAGNMGINSFLKASPEEPIVMYLKDFNDDGQIDPIVGYTRDGKEYPVAPRDELLTPFRFLRSKYPNYKDYAGQTIQQIFGSTISEGNLQKKEVTTLQSIFVENLNDGSFATRRLPTETQWAPISAFLADDFNSAGQIDLITAGNFNNVKPSMGGRFDAGYGLYLQGTGAGKLEPVSILRSGFVTKGEVKAIHQISTGDEDGIIVVARNNLPLLFFERVRE